MVKACGFCRNASSARMRVQPASLFNFGRRKLISLTHTQALHQDFIFYNLCSWRILTSDFCLYSTLNVCFYRKLNQMNTLIAGPKPVSCSLGCMWKLPRCKRTDFSSDGCRHPQFCPPVRVPGSIFLAFCCNWPESNHSSAWCGSRPSHMPLKTSRALLSRYWHLRAEREKASCPLEITKLWCRRCWGRRAALNIREAYEVKAQLSVISAWGSSQSCLS